MTVSISPEGGRRERKREQTADHLATTAFRLFEAQGYDAVAMEQIAAEADVAKGTLYNYFPVKEALLAHQFRREIASGMAGLEPLLAQQPGFHARMRGLLKASAQWNESRRPYLPHYLRYRMTQIGVQQGAASSNQHSGVHRILEALFAAGQKQGEVRADVAPEQLAWLLEFMCMGAVMVWLHQLHASLEQQFLTALEVMLHGVASPAHPGTVKNAE